MSTAYRYDVFISYSHEDRSWVADWLVPALKKEGLRLCVDADDFEPGVFSIVEMERAVVESAKTIVVLTPAYMTSLWATFEHSLAQTGDPAAVGRRVIPVLRAVCQAPPRLAALVHLDFTMSARCTTNLPRLIATVRFREPRPEKKDRDTILGSADAQTFLQYVKDRFQYLDFRGMGVTDRLPLRLPLTDMYVPLKASWSCLRARPGRAT